MEWIDAPSFWFQRYCQVLLLPEFGFDQFPKTFHANVDFLWSDVAETDSHGTSAFTVVSDIETGACDKRDLVGCRLLQKFCCVDVSG